ncbi:MAG: NUDIX domain-containing protein [Candidatus Pacearchaeota archaeon]|nr:NUDIX domain-containing protein [Candidatus Pacearchaeota archaeon]
MEEMKRYRRAVFILVYARANKKIEYLILKRRLHWIGWEFPKGGVRRFETKRGAVKREIREETGLKILKIKKFHVYGKYRYDKKYSYRKNVIGQTFSLYAVEVKKEKVRVSDKEHSDYKWLGFKEALRKLTWNNQKRCLKIVNNYLKDCVSL